VEGECGEEEGEERGGRACAPAPHSGSPGPQLHRTEHSHQPPPRSGTPHQLPPRPLAPSPSSSPLSPLSLNNVERQARQASQAPLRHYHRPPAQPQRQVPLGVRLHQECVPLARSPSSPPRPLTRSLLPLAVYRAHQWTQGYDVKSAADGSSSYRLTCATHSSVPLLPPSPLVDPSLKLTPCPRLQQLPLLDRRHLHHLHLRGRPDHRGPVGLPHLDQQLPACAQPRRALPRARRQGRELPPLAPRPERPGRRPPAPHPRRRRRRRGQWLRRRERRRRRGRHQAAPARARARGAGPERLRGVVSGDCDPDSVARAHGDGAFVGGGLGHVGVPAAAPCAARVAA